MSATVLTLPVRKKHRAEAEIFCDRKKAERTRQLREDLFVSVMNLELEANVEANVSAMMLELGNPGGR